MIFANHFKRVKCSYSWFINLTETAGFFFFLLLSIHRPERKTTVHSFYSSFPTPPVKVLQNRMPELPLCLTLISHISLFTVISQLSGIARTVKPCYYRKSLSEEKQFADKRKTAAARTVQHSATVNWKTKR